MRAHTRHGFTTSDLLDMHRDARLAGRVTYRPTPGVWELQAAADYRTMAKAARTSGYEITQRTPEACKFWARNYIAKAADRRADWR